MRRSALSGSSWPKFRRLIGGLAGGISALLIAGAPGLAHAHLKTGQLNKLTDISLTMLNPIVASTNAQSVCAYSSSTGKTYSIKATGSGTSGAFTLTAGAGILLPYSVQWSASAGASSGTPLTANTALTGQVSNATVAGCSAGAATSASLIVIFSTTDLGAAFSGVSYTGTLTLLLTPT